MFSTISDTAVIDPILVDSTVNMIGPKEAHAVNHCPATPWASASVVGQLGVVVIAVVVVDFTVLHPLAETDLLIVMGIKHNFKS